MTIEVDVLCEACVTGLRTVAVGVEAAEELVRLRVHHELLQQVVAFLLCHHVPLSRHTDHAHTLSSAGLQPASEAQPTGTEKQGGRSARQAPG